jgi:hypothetical protein
MTSSGPARLCEAVWSGQLGNLRERESSRPGAFIGRRRMSPLEPEEPHSAGVTRREAASVPREADRLEAGFELDFADRSPGEIAHDRAPVDDGGRADDTPGERDQGNGTCDCVASCGERPDRSSSIGSAGPPCTSCRGGPSRRSRRSRRAPRGGRRPQRPRGSARWAPRAPAPSARRTRACSSRATAHGCGEERGDAHAAFHPSRRHGASSSLFGNRGSRALRTRNTQTPA